MIYLDHGATSMGKPPEVAEAVSRALRTCGNPGRGGHAPSMEAAAAVYRTRESAAAFFGAAPEQVVFTSSCTHGLNIAIRSLIKPGSTVVVSGFEHNAVVRPLAALGVKLRVAGRKLFDWADTLREFEAALREGADAAVFTHVSNVFGYILPVEAMAHLCKAYGVPFILDAAQSAGLLPVRLDQLGAAFIAMPGHKGLLGPQGTGILLCNARPKPLLYGGTGSHSLSRSMPSELPEALEAGTLNVPGIAGLGAGIRWLQRQDPVAIAARQKREVEACVRGLEALDYRVFAGEHQASTVSFVPPRDCEELAAFLNRRGIAVRAGLHCAPLAHESAGTLESGTVRISFGHAPDPRHTAQLLRTLKSQ